MNKRTPKVLIVDDDPRDLRLMEATVAPMGVETHTAAGGKAALEMIPLISPDVILLDICMPGMDGIELCLRLKEDATTQNIPVVFVTGRTGVQDHAAAIEAGGIGFITKPVDDILVRASVKNAIRMKELAEELEKLLEQRSAFTRMIVHDIRNLLTGLIGYSQMVLSSEALPPSIKDDVVTIERTAKEMSIMTSSVLDVEKLESGTARMCIRTVNVWELAKERAKLLLAKATQRGASLKLHEPENEAIVHADPALLSRVLDNLISNAGKFCPAHGSIEVGASATSGAWAVFVTNDGPPIPREHHLRIFEKFAQVEAREATGMRGIGIGLAFCKAALDAMGGRIEVESPVAGRNDGVSFVFHLPAAQP